MLADLCLCFHQSPTKLCPDLVSFACWIVTKFWSFTRKSLRRLGHSRSKLCQILCRLRAKLCPNFGRSRARLCPIYLASCPFPNLAGTLCMVCDTGIVSDHGQGTWGGRGRGGGRERRPLTSNHHPAMRLIR